MPNYNCIVKEVVRGEKVIPIIENRCFIKEIKGKQFAFLREDPVPIYLADTFHFPIPENLAFEIVKVVIKI